MGKNAFSSTRYSPMGDCNSKLARARIILPVDQRRHERSTRDIIFSFVELISFFVLVYIYIYIYLYLYTYIFLSSSSSSISFKRALYNRSRTLDWANITIVHLIVRERTVLTCLPFPSPFYTDFYCVTHRRLRITHIPVVYLHAELIITLISPSFLFMYFFFLIYILLYLVIKAFLACFLRFLVDDGTSRVVFNGIQVYELCDESVLS